MRKTYWRDFYFAKPGEIERAIATVENRYGDLVLKKILVLPSNLKRKV